MGRNILIFLISAFALAAFANGPDWRREQEQNKVKAEKTLEERQQRMEVLEGDDLGGARSGQGETQQEKAKHDAEKQKFLYEHDGYYRRGL